MRITNAIRSRREFRQEYSQFMGMGMGIRRSAWLVALALVCGVLVSACGSGGDVANQSDQSTTTGTERSERAERQASIMQQQVQQDQRVQQDQQDQQAQSTAETDSASETEQTDQTEQVDVSSVDAPDQRATELGEIDFGHREGLPFIRNVVGDPEAPVVIVEYSDFQ